MANSRGQMDSDDNWVSAHGSWQMRISKWALTSEHRQACTDRWAPATRHWRIGNGQGLLALRQKHMGNNKVGTKKCALARDQEPICKCTIYRCPYAIALVPALICQCQFVSSHLPVPICHCLCANSQWSLLPLPSSIC